MEGWERLDEVIKWTGLSTNAFAMELGMKRSENLYRIRREKNGLSRKLVEKIVQRYPEIDATWLFIGKGNMLNTEEMGITKTISFYDNLDHSALPVFKIESSLFLDSDLGLRTDTDAMQPCVNKGSMLFLKKTDTEVIVYGQMYYFLYKGIYLLRYIRKGPSKNEVVLSAMNPDYDDLTIKKEDIYRIYLVTYSINKLL